MISFSGAAPTRAEAIAVLRAAFASAGLGSPALDARLLLAAAVGAEPAELAVRPDERLSAGEAARLTAYARRRLAREPVGRILGQREFWGLTFGLSPETLEPRPDTETVVETVLRLLPDRRAPLRILDLGTGTGCILVALLHEFGQARGLGLDVSPGALATARRNAWRNGVGGRALFAASDWTAAIRGQFDVIVSNPPYIAAAVIEGLEPDVRNHDPRLALDGGQDGLDAYRAILSDAPRLLAPDGVLAVEIGFDQEDDLSRLAGPTGLDVLTVTHDLSGSPRCVALKAAPS
jgi:release factor glutamine methyltransferase